MEEIQGYTSSQNSSQESLDTNVLTHNQMQSVDLAMNNVSSLKTVEDIITKISATRDRLNSFFIPVTSTVNSTVRKLMDIMNSERHVEAGHEDSNRNLIWRNFSRNAFSLTEDFIDQYISGKDSLTLLEDELVDRLFYFLHANAYAVIDCTELELFQPYYEQLGLTDSYNSMLMECREGNNLTDIVETEFVDKLIKRAFDIHNAINSGFDTAGEIRMVPRVQHLTSATKILFLLQTLYEDDNTPHFVNPVNAEMLARYVASDYGKGKKIRNLNDLPRDLTEEDASQIVAASIAPLILEGRHAVYSGPSTIIGLKQNIFGTLFPEQIPLEHATMAASMSEQQSGFNKLLPDLMRITATKKKAIRDIAPLLVKKPKSERAEEDLQLRVRKYLIKNKITMNEFMGSLNKFSGEDKKIILNSFPPEYKDKFLEQYPGFRKELEEYSGGTRTKSHKKHRTHKRSKKHGKTHKKHRKANKKHSRRRSRK